MRFLLVLQMTVQVCEQTMLPLRTLVVSLQKGRTYIQPSFHGHTQSRSVIETEHNLRGTERHPPYRAASQVGLFHTYSWCLKDTARNGDKSASSQQQTISEQPETCDTVQSKKTDKEAESDSLKVMITSSPSALKSVRVTPGKGHDCDKSKNNDIEEASDPSLEVMASASPTALRSAKVVPGKGPPPEPPVDCCMSGCANCVWILYAEELKDYYSDGGEAARQALEQIENPSLKAFLKLELGL
ncbi:hypothetical protein BaRGS_00000841 [Batillaria attramentaria]|uniref:Oxidoreductase-like domain-containing protein n=1 Tax=Batillaria attramentaria TaxID=370345 RepID=A0ABD0M914_9CAEN